MSNTNTGGPAFPTGTAFQGMTLRDYFAAKALQAIIQSGIRGPGVADLLQHGDDQEYVAAKASCLAKGAYQMADAMLRARQS